MNHARIAIDTIRAEVREAQIERLAQRGFEEDEAVAIELAGWLTTVAWASGVISARSAMDIADMIGDEARAALLERSKV